MRTRQGVLAVTVLAILLAGCERWKPLDAGQYIRYRSMLRSDLNSYVLSQETYFTDHDRYATSPSQVFQHLDTLTPGQDYLRLTEGVRIFHDLVTQDGYSAIAFHDSVPQMVCAVYAGPVPPPLGDDSAEWDRTCRRESAILVCEEGHAYPGITRYELCPVHGVLLEEHVIGG